MNKSNLLTHPFACDITRLGGKASNLIRLQQKGYRVPPFVVIPGDALRDLLPQDLDFQDVKNFIAQYHFPQTFLQEIVGQFHQSDNTPLFFAVRSSANVEDGTENSFAGQFQTELYVTPDTLQEAIRTVWLSAYGTRAMAYGQERGATWKGGGISIIVQEMIAADAAGVGFGLHPTEGWRDAVVISAVYGLGEGLVSGLLDADTYVERGGVLEKTMAAKKQGLFYSPDNQKVIAVEIELAAQQAQVLTDAQIQETASMIRQLNRDFGRPQDVEFAYFGSQLYLLQTRPITNLNQLPDRSAHRIIWDNSNIIESYPGVTTPLTFSFIIKMYEAVYRQMADIMGVSETVIEQEKEVFASMLGLLRGRVYYNLESWYRALAMLPGYHINAGFMETMMGVKERFELPGETTKKSAFHAWVQVVWSAIKMLGLLIGLPADRRRFKATLDAIIAEYQGFNFDVMPPEKAMERYLFFEDFLLKKWKAPLVNDFFAMIFFGILKKKCAAISPDNPSLHNDLLTGSRDIISTEPFRRIRAIAAALHSDQQARAFFLENDAAFIWKNIGQYPDIQLLINGYLDAFGERTVGELKLETITYAQDPTKFIAILQSYARQPLPANSTHDDQAIRRQAEALVDKAYRNAPVKKWFFNWLLQRARSLVSSRENLRYERTRGFGVVRRIFSGIGVQFAGEGILESPRDIFFLTKEEVFDFIKGRTVSLDVKGLVRFRKAEFEQFSSEEPLPERITTFGVVYHANSFKHPEKSLQPLDIQEDGQFSLQGLGCSAGIVQGRVRVVTRPDELVSLEGDILVTSSTDPGWVALFPSASGVLVERGSLLSHSAIVSRELGIPCVVGITGLLTKLKTGDWVQLDGSTGLVLVTSNAV